MAVMRDQGKTTFVKELLKTNKQANPKIVNDAWKATGHEGAISDTLVNKIRSELKLTGNIRPGRRPAAAKGGAPKAKLSVVKKTPVAPAAKATEKPRTTPAPTSPKPATPDRRGAALTDMERQIDALLFEVHGAGGIPEFEEALRAARRVLVRSHGE